MAHNFLKAAQGSTRLQAQTEKGGPLQEFTLEGATWTLIAVFNVLNTKSPLQGAYIDEEDFSHDMRELDLPNLLVKYPEVRLSPMGEIRSWIETSEAFYASRQ